MAMYTLIEINGDHIGDLCMQKDNPEAPEDYLAHVIAAVVRNPSNAHLLEQCGIHRAVRIVRQSGNPISVAKMEDGNV